MTIKDIAKLCGVSISTVSRVLNGRPDVSAAVREKVMAVVESNNYIPNNSARDLVRSSSDTIGIVVRGGSNLFFTEVLQTAVAEIDRRGYNVVTRQISSDEDEVKAGAILEREKKLRGLLFLGGRFDYTPGEMALLNVPFVCCSYTNCFGSLGENDFSSVSVDDQAVAREAVSYLVEQGHRRIAALVPRCDDRSISELRYMGYRAALEEHGIAFDKNLLVEIGEHYSMEEAYAGIGELIGRNVDFTAVFTLSDTMAMAAMKALSDYGRRVPEDCSVIAIDGIHLSAYTVPTLTTMVQPAEQLGGESVRILLDMVEGKGGPCHVTLEARMRSGATVRQLD